MSDSSDTEAATHSLESAEGSSFDLTFEGEAMRINYGTRRTLAILIVLLSTVTVAAQQEPSPTASKFGPLRT